MFKLLSDPDLNEKLDNESANPVDRAMTVFSNMIAEKIEEEEWDRMDD